MVFFLNLATVLNWPLFSKHWSFNINLHVSFWITNSNTLQNFKTGSIIQKLIVSWQIIFLVGSFFFSVFFFITFFTYLYCRWRRQTSPPCSTAHVYFLLSPSNRSRCCRWDGHVSTSNGQSTVMAAPFFSVFFFSSSKPLALNHLIMILNNEERALYLFLYPHTNEERTATPFL